LSLEKAKVKGRNTLPYRDLRDYLAVLESKGLLKWTSREVDKDWEISCVSRVVMSRPEHDRFAVGFRRVKGYEVPVVVGIIAANRAIYATALETSQNIEDIIKKWSDALSKPIDPIMVDKAPCKEVVHYGEDVNLNKFPIPVWTPEKDPAPFLTAPCVVTKDPETGIRNVGIYRIQIKGKNKTGVLWDLPSQHAAIHFSKYEALGKPMPAAIVIGADPTVCMTAAAKVPFGVDEFAVSGGLRGKPLELVKCETVDLEVPASSEIVLEGEFLPHVREPEGPFGEYTGYMGPVNDMPVFNVKCITHRADPIYHAILSQMPPSESSLLRQISTEAEVYKHLVHDLKIPGIIDVHCPESGGSYAILWIRMKNTYLGHAKQVLSASWTHHPSFAKWIVVADQDVNIRDPFVREWVLSFRVQPDKDVLIIPNTSSILLDPSAAPPEVPLWKRHGSKILIDATRKWQYPDIALPPQKYLNKVKERWLEYGL